MERLTEDKIVLIIRETRLDDLVGRYNTPEQAKFYVERMGADFDDYLAEDHRYKIAVARTREILSAQGRVQVLHRRYLPNFIFGENDHVVVIGQDGLVANTLKYLDMQPIVGVNPDPERWDGSLLPFQVNDLSRLMPEVIKKQRGVENITMAKVTLSDRQTLYAVNDFYIGARTHVSARYSIEIRGVEENHSSSGIIVSTGLGSTGWLKSVIAGAKAITRAVSREDTKMQVEERCAWDADHLYFSVREPFPSKTTSASLVFGRIKRNTPLSIVSKMPGNGVIFSDGIENDFLEFNSGVKAVVSMAGRKGHLIV